MYIWEGFPLPMSLIHILWWVFPRNNKSKKKLILTWDGLQLLLKVDKAVGREDSFFANLTVPSFSVRTWRQLMVSYWLMAHYCGCYAQISSLARLSGFIIKDTKYCTKEHKDLWPEDHRSKRWSLCPLVAHCKPDRLMIWRNLAFLEKGVTYVKICHPRLKFYHQVLRRFTIPRLVD